MTRIYVTDRITVTGQSARAPADTVATTDQLLPHNQNQKLPNNPTIQPPAEPSEKLVGRAVFLQKQANAWQEKLVDQHRADMAAVMPELADEPAYERKMDENGLWGDPNVGAQAFHRQAAQAWKGKSK